MHPHQTRLQPLRRLAILFAGLALVPLTAWVHAQSDAAGHVPQPEVRALPSPLALAPERNTLVVAKRSGQQTMLRNTDTRDVWDSWSEGEFVHQAVASGRAEIAAARLALQQARSPEVKAFASELEREHTRLNQRLLSLQTAHSMRMQPGSTTKDAFVDAADPTAMVATPTPAAAPDQDSKAAPRRHFHPPSLQALSYKHGIEFDLAFMDWQINHHHAALRRFEVAAERTNDNAGAAGASSLARDALPSLRQHVARAEELARQLASR
ncbi:MAG: DUF4142 domain-containing protein [Lysobacteraceae bacterium]